MVAEVASVACVVLSKFMDVVFKTKILRFVRLRSKNLMGFMK